MDTTPSSVRWDDAIAILAEGRNAEAEALMRALLAAGPANPRQTEILARVIYNHGVESFGQAGFAAAEPLLREAHGLAPALPELRRGLAEVLVRRGLDHAARMEWAAAIQVAGEAAALLPDLRAALGASAVVLAQRLHDDGLNRAATEPVLACRLLLAAWTLCPNDGGKYASARSLFVHLGTGELGTPVAAAEFETLLAEDPADLVALLGLANLHRRARRLNLAETLCRRALAHSPGNPFAQGRLASILAEQGRTREADRLFLDLGQRHGGIEAEIRLSADFLDSLRHAPPLGEVAPIATEAAQGHAFVVMAGCDKTYFHRFADALANSLAGTRRAILLHLHVVDPDDAVAGRLQAMRARLPGLSIRLTTEPRPDRLRPELLRTFFACARFLQLPRILAAYRLPVLMLDVDAVVLRDVAPLVEQLRLEDADLALIHGETRDPWCSLWADAILAAPSPRAIDYFEMVGRYIQHFLASGQAVWFLDQIALFAVAAGSARDRGALRTIAWPTDIQNSSTDHAYFWSLHVSQPTNAAAPDSAFYQRFKNNAVG